MVTRWRQCLGELYEDEAGAVLTEYVLLTLLVAVFSFAAISFFGKNLSNKMNNVGATVSP